MRVRSMRLVTAVALLMTVIGVPASPSAPVSAAPSATGFETVPSTQLGTVDAVQSTVVVDEAGTFHVAYRDGKGAGLNIFLSSSRDGGQTWGAGIPVSDSSINAYAPSIVTSGGRLYIGYLGFECTSTLCGYLPYLAIADINGSVQERHRLGNTPIQYEPLALAPLGEGAVVAWRSFGDHLGSARWIRYDQADERHRAVFGSGFTAAALYGLQASGDGTTAAVVAVGADRVARLAMWRPNDTKPTTDVPFVPQETFAGLAAAEGRAHLVSVVSNEEPSGSAQRLEPADQTGRVRVRTWDPANNILPTNTSSIVGTTPQYLRPNVDVAARAGLLAVAWEDAATRSIMTTSSIDGGIGFGDDTIVPDSLGADALQLTVAPLFDDPSSQPVARFDWSMPERYAPDPNGELVPFLSTISANPLVTVTLDGCASVAGSELTYQWTIDGQVQQDATCEIERRLPANTDYTVRLQVTDEDSQVGFMERTVRPRDLLVVSIGDSIASGEGNPTKPANFTIFGNPSDPTDLQLTPEEWVDQACHRSADAGPAQAARRLEQFDRKSSVTFVHLACSGASIVSGDVAEPDTEPWKTGGVLDRYEGIEPLTPATSEAEARPSQLDQLETQLGDSNRQIDAMFVSIGANDVRFSDVVRECIKSRVTDPFPCNESGTADRLDQRLGDLPRRYELLGDALSTRHPELGADPSRVFITEYFDPTTDSFGLPNLRCIANAEDIAEVADWVATIADLAEKLGVVNPALGALGVAADIVNTVFEGGLVTDDEARWANTEVVAALNDAVRAGATANGWTYVGGIAQRFRGHGYCADDPDRWVVTIGDSIRNQFDANGPVHPNKAGHLVFANALARAAARVVLSVPPDAPQPGQAAVAAGDLGEAALGFTVRYEGGADYLGTPQSFVVANLRDHGTSLEATDVRVIDRLVGAPAQTVSTWYQGQGVAVSDRATVATWFQTYAANVPGGSGYDVLAGQAFMGAPNVAVEKVSLVQAPDDPIQLVAGKATVVRARLVARLAAPTDVTVRVVVAGQDGTVYDHTTTQRLNPGANDVLLPSGSVLTPKAGDFWSAKVLVTDPGEDAPDEEEGSDDVAETAAVGTVATTPMKILFAPAPTAGATCADAVRVATRTVGYARAALPLAEGAFTASYGGLDPAAYNEPYACPVVVTLAQTPDDVNKVLEVNDRIARLAGVDAVVGIVPEGWLADSYPDSDPWGVAWAPVNGGPPNRGVILETGVFDNVLAHELSHLHGVEHNGLDTTQGVWVSRRQTRLGPDYMFKPAQPTRWVHPETFDKVLEVRRGLAPAVPDGSGLSIRVSGIIAPDGSGVPRAALSPWLSTPATDPDANGSPLLARQLDAGGLTIATTPLALGEMDGDYPTPGNEVPGGYYGFAHALALDPDTVSIELEFDGKPIATRPVTASPPVVIVDTPEAGVTLQPGDPLDIAWTANDPEGGALTHSVLVSPDGGANWQPLAIDITETTLSTTIPDTLVGDDVVVRVVSSDGVRSGVGLSGSFRVAIQQRGPERVVYVKQCATDCTGFQGVEGDYRGVWTANPDGTDERLVAAWNSGGQYPQRTQFMPNHPDWSPDGRKLAMASRAFYENPPLPVGQLFLFDRSDLFVTAPDGSNRVRITQPVADPNAELPITEDELLQFYCPDWSPDGIRISAIAWSRDNPWIVSMLADGSDLRVHGRSGGALSQFSGCPRWSPDGTVIAAAVEFSGALYGGQLPARDGPWYAANGSMIDPTTIVGWSATTTSTTSWGVEIAPVKKTEPTISNELILQGISWTPDGTALLVGVGNNGCGIMRVEADGSGQSQVINCLRPRTPQNQVIDNFFPWGPQVTPDGTRIAFSSSDSGTASSTRFGPTLCTVPADSIVTPAPIYSNQSPAGLQCVVSPGVLASTPPTTPGEGRIQYDWSAGPVLDGGGGSAGSSAVVIPDADAGGPYTVDEDTDLVLDASASGLGVDGSTFEWDLDDDGAFDDGTGATIVTRWPDAGDRTVEVRVTRGASSATATADVTVRSVAPRIGVPLALFARAGSPTVLAPFTVDDPGTGGHTATAVIGGAPATAVIDGSQVRVTATIADAGPVDGTLTVCDDVPSGACVDVPFTVEVDAGPVIEAAVPAVVSPSGGTRVLLSGRHLAGSTTVDVDGSEIDVDSASDDVVAFDMPPGTVGSVVAVSVVGAEGSVDITYLDLAARDQRLLTQVDTPVQVELLALDGSNDGLVPAAHELVTPPAHGTLGAPLVLPQDADPNATDDTFLGSVAYTPDPGFVGTDTFVVRVLGDTRTATVTVKVGNLAPTPGADSVSAKAGQVSVIDTATLLANDVDPDAADWPAGRVEAVTTGLQIVAVYSGAGMPGEVWLDDDGVMRFSVPPTASGTTSFEYAVADPQGGTSFGAVTVRLIPVDTPNPDPTPTTTTTTTTTPSGPPVTAPPTTLPPGGRIPSTGGDPAPILQYALTAIGVGLGLLLIRRRRARA